MRYKKLVVFTALALPALTHLSAVAQTCPDNVPHITGTWTVLPYQMPINPISADLLPNGKVLIVAGSEHDASNNSEGAESYRGAVWDPSGTDETSISVHNLTYDVFCSGTAALFDGRSLMWVERRTTRRWCSPHRHYRARSRRCRCCYCRS